MLEPLAVDPNRSVAPAANSMASAKLVFPAPAGPTSAMTRVPLDGCPAMRLSLRAVTGARVGSREALGRRVRNDHRPTVLRAWQECSLAIIAVCRGTGFGPARFGRGDGRSEGTSCGFAG